jgi:hypothetical protein
VPTQPHISDNGSSLAAINVVGRRIQADPNDGSKWTVGLLAVATQEGRSRTIARRYKAMYILHTQVRFISHPRSVALVGV